MQTVPAASQGEQGKQLLYKTDYFRLPVTSSIVFAEFKIITYIHLF